MRICERSLCGSGRKRGRVIFVKFNHSFLHKEVESPGGKSSQEVCPSSVDMGIYLIQLSGLHVSPKGVEAVQEEALVKIIDQRHRPKERLRFEWKIIECLLHQHLTATTPKWLQCNNNRLYLNELEDRLFLRNST